MHVCICVCVCVCVCVYVCVYVWMYIQTNVWLGVRMYIYVIHLYAKVLITKSYVSVARDIEYLSNDRVFGAG